MHNIITISNLHKKFGEKVIFDKAAITIPLNAFFAITGKSGSGKTTLLNIISLLDYPQSADYDFMGTKIDWKNKDQHSLLRNKYIGFIFQAYNLLPKFSVKENICLPLLYRKGKVDGSFLNGIVTKLCIGDLLKKKIDVLSGGEKQRVAIARALITNPDIIICDEPTGNLDSNNAEYVLQVLENERRKGKTIIFVTHSNSFENYYTEHVILSDGIINVY